MELIIPFSLPVMFGLRPSSLRLSPIPSGIFVLSQSDLRENRVVHNAF